VTGQPCRGCGHGTELVLDLGGHYLPDFILPGEPRGARYPLQLVLCPACTLLQLDGTVPRDALYHERYGFRSGTNEAVRADLQDVVSYALGTLPAPRRHLPEPPRWLDIACNDGTLLGAVPARIRRTGVDPLAHLAGQVWAAGADRVVSGYFSPDSFEPRSFEVVTSVSMFYDLDDPGAFCCGVREVLARRGAWVIQQNYSLAMLANNAADNICHEHVTYFSVTSLAPLLAAHGLEINDVTRSAVNGGCFRTLVSRRGEREVRPSVAAALAAEEAAGLGSPETWERWGKEVAAELGKTRDFLEQAKAGGESVWLYGASTRGGTLLQMIGAGPDLLPFAAERSPAKVGRVMAATGIPIVSEEAMREARPDYLLVSPWFFRDVFVEREKDYLAAGGRMVFPLPEFGVVSR